MSEVAARLEKGLKFVGVTAVEDRLQEGVPETIKTIKEMGIRVWVLTGDKTETAVDIAKSCRLFEHDMILAYVCEADSTLSAFRKLQSAESEFDNQDNTGLVLDGPTIHYALMDPACRTLIHKLGVSSRSCV